MIMVDIIALIAHILDGTRAAPEVWAQVCQQLVCTHYDGSSLLCDISVFVITRYSCSFEKIEKIDIHGFFRINY